jgi:threonine dehydratase
VTVVDRMVTVSSDEALEIGRRLHTEDGLLVGISSGAAFAAALKVSSSFMCTIELGMPVLSGYFTLVTSRFFLTLVSILV